MKQRLVTISSLLNRLMAQVSGAEKSAVRVQVDPARLAALGLSLEDVRAFLETLREEGVLAPTGAQAIL